MRISSSTPWLISNPLVLLLYRNSAPPSEDQSTSNNNNSNRARNNNNGGRGRGGGRNSNSGRGRGSNSNSRPRFSNNNTPRFPSSRGGQASLKLENPFKVQRIVAAPAPPRRPREQRDNNNSNSNERRGPRQAASAGGDSDGNSAARTGGPSESGRSRPGGRGRCYAEAASKDIFDNDPVILSNY